MSFFEGIECVGCAAKPPVKRSEQTLTSQLGWRLRREMRPDGPRIEWRCPACWEAFKEAMRPSAAPR